MAELSTKYCANKDGFLYSMFSMKQRNSFGLFYALIVLLAVAYISTASLRGQGVGIDMISNLHLRYQSDLYTQSVLEMAKLCLQNLDEQECKSDEFIFDKQYNGGYDLVDANEQRYEVHIYIEAKNLRTSQIQRTLTRVYLPIASSAKSD